MKYECAMIEDLLPLYADGVCSHESRKIVDEHLAECENCRAVLEQMQAQMPQEDCPKFSGEEVLKETAWNISKRAVLAAAGITAIVLYWIVFFCEDALASAGDYRYFSFRFHEVFSLGYLLVPVATTIWLLVRLYRCWKTCAWRKNAAILLLLLLLTAGQWNYMHYKSQTIHVNCTAHVVEIVDRYHIVIETWQGNVTLKTTPIIVSLLETDGTEYAFSYEYHKSNPNEGTLDYAVQIDE